jgi:hypothetical protein
MRIEVTEQATIDRPAWEVRDQFRDLTYHAANAVHGRHPVAVLERRSGRVRYAMRVHAVRTARVEVVMSESVHGALVNEVTSGAFAGSIFTYEFEWSGPHTTTVVATVSLELTGAWRATAPLLRAWLGKTLRQSLEEDRVDLESGRYSRVGRRFAHPSLV